MKKTILLTFDAEEFDAPLDYGIKLPLKEQIEISREGTGSVLELLKRCGIKATFFCTANFAMEAVSTILRIRDEGHEIASHSFLHGSFDVADLRRSKSALEEITGREVQGFRMPRLESVREEDVAKAEYVYNSSLNPTYIPGRYNHLFSPRTFFEDKGGVIQIPTSVTPHLRFPLGGVFPLRNLPFTWYKWLFKRTLQHDEYVCIYLHPWEFFPLERKDLKKMPYFFRHNTGKDLEKRLEQLIQTFKNEAQFLTMGEFVKEIPKGEK